tara:strand:+ start:473 stop:1009 length:537 start_codon:yes stop_codon:yes gene_type:complete
MTAIVHKLFVLSLVFGAVSSPLAAAERTAQEIEANAGELVGQRVTLDVAWLKLLRHSGNRNQYAVIAAYTWDEDSERLGGTIPVVIDSEGAKRLLSRYEAKPDGRLTWFSGVDLDTKRLSGTLRRGGEDRNLYIDLTSGPSSPIGLNLASEMDAKRSEIEAKISEAIAQKVEELKNNN